MNEGIRRSVVASPDVTVEAAAELSGVGVATVRDWAENGTLTIRALGDMEVVELDRVRTLAARERTHGRSALRARLQGARGPAEDGQLDVGELQHLARERAGRKR
jgi:CTP:molybdopterin cytidylyltransferase MocA